MDDTLLKQFELTSPELTTLQQNIEKLQAEYRELDQPPTKVKLEDGYKRMRAFHEQTTARSRTGDEIDHWRKASPTDDEDKEVAKREPNLARNAASRFGRHQERFGDSGTSNQSCDCRAPDGPDCPGAGDIPYAIGCAGGAVAELVSHSNAGTCLPDQLKPVYFDLQSATEYAREKTDSLMNEQGRVVDAWRQIAVTANQLQAGLDVVFNGNLTTQPGKHQPVDFRQSAKHVQLWAFCSMVRQPFGAAQYLPGEPDRLPARAPDLYALDDDIQRSVRLDLRSLARADRINFELARQS